MLVTNDGTMLYDVRSTLDYLDKQGMTFDDVVQFVREFVDLYKNSERFEQIYDYMKNDMLDSLGDKVVLYGRDFDSAGENFTNFSYEIQEVADDLNKPSRAGNTRKDLAGRLEDILYEYSGSLLIL